MSIYEKKLSVQFGDVDIHNRLTMKGALRLMQEACNCHSQAVGFGVNDIETTGYSWMLHQQRLQLYERPRWNTPLCIRTWSRGAQGPLCLRDFEARRESGELVAVAASGWLLVNAATQRLEQASKEMLLKFGTEERGVFDEPLRRLKALPDAEKRWEYTILRRDIDINRHTNNLCYLDYALESLPEEYDEADFNEADLLYKKAAFLGDRIACFGAWEPGGGGQAEGRAAEEEPAAAGIKRPPAYVAAIRSADAKLLHAVVRLAKAE